jgi:hypothetical protein
VDPAALSALAAAVGSALIDAMTTDAWDTVRNRMAKVLSREHAKREHDFAGQLETSRARLRAGVNAGDGQPSRQAELDQWTRRISSMLHGDASLAAELEGVLKIIRQAAAQPASTLTQQIMAQRDAYTSGGDQYIHLEGGRNNES